LLSENLAPPVEFVFLFLFSLKLTAVDMALVATLELLDKLLRPSLMIRNNKYLKIVFVYRLLIKTTKAKYYDREPFYQTTFSSI